MDYPKRSSHFAHKFSRLLFKSCAAQDIGHHAVLLLVHIVHTEDAARYQGPVRFWNSQLLETLGFSSERQLRQARDKAIAAGWLVYARASVRSVGHYFVLIPERVDFFDDSPIEEPTMCKSAHNSDLNSAPRTVGVVHHEPSESCTENRRNPAQPSNPVPDPKPNPLPETREGEKDWLEVRQGLEQAGVKAAASAVSKAKRHHWTAGHALAVLSHYRSKPGAWTPATLYGRFDAEVSVPDDGWPDESAEWKAAAKSAARARLDQADAEKRRQELAVKQRERETEGSVDMSHHIRKLAEASEARKRQHANN